MDLVIYLNKIFGEICNKQGIDARRDLTLSLPDTCIFVNFSTVYNDTLVAKGLNVISEFS